MSLVVVGDALLDRDLTGTVDRLCPDAPVPVVDAPVDVPRPGGAGLAALLAAAVAARQTADAAGTAAGLRVELIALGSALVLGAALALLIPRRRHLEEATAAEPDQLVPQAEAA